jgi:hypothetical protein
VHCAMGIVQCACIALGEQQTSALQYVNFSLYKEGYSKGLSHRLNLLTAEIRWSEEKNRRYYKIRQKNK